MTLGCWYLRRDTVIRITFTCALLIAAGEAVLPGQTVSAQKPPTCGARSDLVGSCYRVRGRVLFYNGTPSFRMWPVGTHRLLGLQPDEQPMVPDNVQRLLPSVVDGKGALFGNFLVCPVTREEAGRMQRICVESATDLILRPR